MCYSLAPAIFTDDEGHSEVRGDGAVPADLAAEARVGAASCPGLAITLG
jgi:ferredoxin